MYIASFISDDDVTNCQETFFIDLCGIKKRERKLKTGENESSNTFLGLSAY